MVVGVTLIQIKNKQRNNHGETAFPTSNNPYISKKPDLVVKEYYLVRAHCHSILSTKLICYVITRHLIESK